MTAMIQGDQLRNIVLGATVTKALTNPQGALGPLFTVTGGLVMITAIVGEVTTVQGATTNSFNLQYTKSGGSAVDVSAATVCTSDAVGTLYSITGVAADLVSAQKVGGTEVPNVTFAAGLIRPLMVDAGSLGLLASGSNTGATRWVLTYVPLDNGASVAAA